MSSARDLVSLAEQIAREAGALAVEQRRGLVEVANTKTSPTDVVTEVDIAVERLIRSRLAQARPDDAVVGEEGDDSAGTSGLTWLADPIDGTVNFLYDIAQYAVSLAARDSAGTIVGVVHHAASGETFSAVRGEGAWLDGRPIHTSECTDPARALTGVGFSYRADVRTHQGAELAKLLPRIRDIRRLGSAALDLCYVACGRLDAYAERGLKPWDLAAGRLVCTEAGGRVEGMHRAEPGERLVAAAPERLFDAFHGELVSAGFDRWPMPEWPAT